MKLNNEQINVVRGYFERKFNTGMVTFLCSSDNKVVFSVHNQEFIVLFDDDFSVTIVYMYHGKLERLKGGFSLGLMENDLCWYA